MSIRAFLVQYIGSNLRIFDKLEREVAAITTEDGREWVPVVRCRDCEYMRELHPLNPITGVPAGITVYRCSYFWTGDELPEVEPDGFCAWGERKEDA